MKKLLFDEAYDRLNAAQRQAVDTIEGPVMVIAGPGTGKTQILTLRIANILKQTQAQPENILALTFTESGARAMRERLARYIGAPAYRVPIYTFHEFAGILIRTYPDAYTRSVGGRPITDLEKITLVGSLIDSPGIKFLRPTGKPEFYIKPILSALSTMKREYITPDRFREIIAEQEKELRATQKIHEKGAHKGKVRSEYIDREKRVNKNRELLFVYRAYEASLKEHGHFDYDDMIFETVEALIENEDMLRSLQEQYHYILADEHQDVNGSQNKILELLASFHERPNIFVVGDEKQSIYRFQGASLENFLYFEEKFPHTTTIALTKNYRSVQGVLDLAHELITVNPGPASSLRVPLEATRKDTAIIEERHFSHEAVEHDFLIEKIRTLLKEGVSSEEIALIVRTNKEVEDLSGYLRKHGIATEASADGDILSHPITISIRTLISAVVNPSDERMLFEVLHSGYSCISVPDLVRIMGHKSYVRPLSSIVTDPVFLESIGVLDIDAVLKIPHILETARKEMSVKAPHRVLEYLLTETGFIEHALTIDPHEGGRVIRRLYDEIEDMVRREDAVTLRDIEVMFTARISHQLPLEAPYIRTNRHAVSVMTAHKAKGLEFLYVFIPHLTDTKWGGRSHPTYFDIPITTHMQNDTFDAGDDERKLLYVALTRAKVGLYISDSETSTEGRSLLSSRLLEGIGEEIFSTEDTDVFEARFNPLQAVFETNTTPSIDTEFLTSVLSERGLSATALNNYLRDPWNYFYRNVLRIPEVQAPSAQFGTVLHDTLRSVMRHKREHGKLPTTTNLKMYMECELEKLPLTHNEYVRHHERALLALTQYMAHIESQSLYETKEEYKIQVMFKTGIPDFPELLLTGMLDRLDFDREGRLIRVIDYKSGKPKTRGYIEGTTKNSNGDYKRQLVFYALLLSLHDDERLRTREGVLSFIEADEKGMLHEEAYMVTDEEIDDLKDEIIRVTREITHGAFLHAPCDPEKSDYCMLVDALRKKSL